MHVIVRGGAAQMIAIMRSGNIIGASIFESVEELPSGICPADAPAKQYAQNLLPKGQ